MRLGADPEVFLSLETIHEGLGKTSRLFPVCGLIGASKHNPKPMGNVNGFAVQEDNVALEYNIPPSASKPEFISNITQGLKLSLQQINTKGMPANKKITFSKLSANIFDPTDLVHPSAKVFGCDPDFNAWTKEQNKKPKLSGKMKNLRSCGGHIHVETQEDPYLVARAMDLFVGVPFTYFEGHVGELRRKLYGKAGACRVKPYGVEYRSLSNLWIFSPDLIGWVWDQTERALENVNQLPYEDLAGPVQGAINSGAPDKLKALISAFDLEVPQKKSDFLWASQEI